MEQTHLYLTRLLKPFRYYNSTSTSMNYSEIEVPKEIQITCSKCITTEALFQEAMGDIYSHRYFQHHHNQFAKMVFLIEIKEKERYWGILKDSQQIKAFFAQYQIEQALSQRIRTSLSTIESLTEEQQAKIIEQSLTEVAKANSDCFNQPFFESQREGVGRFIMKKKSGGRLKESTCCKFGSLFERSKQRTLIIFRKGVGYYNDRGHIRQFLAFSHGFHFEIGKPSTGLELGINIYANHRKLSLQALNIKDFIYFLFTLRKACKESCYTSINRFNSFAPLRYSSSAKFFVDGEDYFDALLQSLGNASKSILIMGWMLSPQFLLKREGYRVSVEDVLKKADSKGVIIKIILYQESSFLSNGSQYTKEKLQKLKNVIVLCHPCGKDAVLWSHNQKIVIIDEKEAFVGSLDICYGRYDKPTHQLFPSPELYPGLEYNNIRKNDQWDVKSPTELGVSRHQSRLPWHDIAQSLKGDVVTDLIHHFYQMWNFVRFQNMSKPEAEGDLDNDVKTIFSAKILPGEESESSRSSGFFKAIENRLNTIKLKGQDMLKSVKQKIVGQQKRQPSRTMRLSAPQDYFNKYVHQIAAEIEQKKEAYKSLAKKTNKNRNSAARSSRSSRYSVDQVKKVKESVQSASPKEEGLKKTNSFLLTGNKIIDFMAVEIDHDYIDCLQKVNNQMKPTQEDGQMKEIQSDEEILLESQMAFQDKSFAVGQGRDQCQIIRSVGNWSVGCHSSNIEFSIHIAYLQLISQAKHFIYVENQFFISSLANPKLVKNQVAEAIYLRIRKAIQNNQRFKVFVVLPLLPGFSGDMEVEDCLLLRKQMQWQYDTICRGQNSLWQRLLAHTDDPSQYIRFLGLRNHGRLKQEWQPQTQIIYVHSKLVIVDDQIVLCGSANINDRSLYGDRDSEIAVVTRGEDYIEGRLNGEPALVSQMAQELRIKLWMEHFGFTEQEATDPISDTTCQAIAQRAAHNTVIYRRIFGCYPDDEITTRKMIQEKRKESNIQLYDQLSPQIIGHVVEFPLRFLVQDSVTDLRTEKEFSVPTQCFT